MNLLNQSISIELNLAEAIVLDDFINKKINFESEIVELSNQEKQALSNFQCLLEKILTEPLIKDYANTLEAAKKYMTK